MASRVKVSSVKKAEVKKISRAADPIAPKTQVICRLCSKVFRYDSRKRHRDLSHPGVIDLDGKYYSRLAYFYIVDVNPNPVQDARNYNNKLFKRDAKLAEKTQEKERDKRTTMVTASKTTAAQKKEQKKSAKSKKLAGRNEDSDPSYQAS